MTDGLSTLYRDLLGGSYDCVDRIVLNADFRMGHDPGGFRVWWRALTGSDERSKTPPVFKMLRARTIKLHVPSSGLPIALYGFLCDYGRSYIRPVFILVVTVAIGALPLWAHFGLSKCGQAIGLSLAKIQRSWLPQGSLRAPGHRIVIRCAQSRRCVANWHWSCLALSLQSGAAQPLSNEVTRNP
jgi:hypothetical protein